MRFRIRCSPYPSKQDHRTLPPAHIRMRRLRTSRYAIPDCGWVTCVLWRLSFESDADARWPAYALSMAGLGSRRLVILGGDEARAHAVHALVTRHTVTPCALRDVLEEL